MFTIVEEGYVVLRKGGIFRPAKIYLRDQYVFAGYGGGFIRLGKNDGSTSVPQVTYEDLFVPFDLDADPVGRLIAKHVPAR